MQKVYLLLRNNSQTGPFNLDELLQFDLKPFDLIWIEGRSAGWYYPQEIEALKPYLSFVAKGDGLATVESTPQTHPAQTSTAPLSQPAALQSTSIYTQPSASKKIYVSMPTAAVAEQKPESKKEALRTSDVHQQYMPPQPEVKPAASADTPQFSSSSYTSSTNIADKSSLKTSYNKSLDDVETDYMNWMYQKKTKKKPLFSKSGIVVLGLLGVGLTTVWYFANKPKTEATETSFQQPAVATPIAETPANTNPASNTNLASTSTNKKQHAVKHAVVVKNAPETSMPTTRVKKAVLTHASNDATMPVDNPTSGEVYKPSPVLKEESKPAAETQQPVTTDAAPKKKLREKIYDLFHKKSEEKKEEAKPAENENGSRQSTRREAGSSLAQLVTVKFEIPNSWMMGIKGAKVTLANRSSETLAKAVVEVRYYNDDNDLLDKKNIVFSNIKSKQSGTVSVPEHATATRLEYSVLSATGAGDAVAFLR